MSRGDQEGRCFASVARRLAGMAGWHLRWCPDAFWSATPAEMESVIRVMLGDMGDDDPAASLNRADMQRLQEIFPDG